MEKHGFEGLQSEWWHFTEDGKGALNIAMELLENDEVKLIIFATGGDFLCEILDHLDFEKIKDMTVEEFFNAFVDLLVSKKDKERDFVEKNL